MTKLADTKYRYGFTGTLAKLINGYSRLFIHHCKSHSNKGTY